eukprot:scaffold1830_cov246-Pinguiococcus_pyrenoidosus.AAC.10
MRPLPDTAGVHLRDHAGNISKKAEEFHPFGKRSELRHEVLVELRGFRSAVFLRSSLSAREDVPETPLSGGFRHRPRFAEAYHHEVPGRPAPRALHKPAE